MIDISFEFSLLLIALGFVAGIINTMAGGGSNLTLPALMVLGLPADVANATNRVSVFFQSMTATRGFYKHGKLDMPDIKAVVAITIAGGLAGAFVASYLPVTYLKPTLLATMIVMAAIILFKPSLISVPFGELPKNVRTTPQSIPMLFIAGFYGGFVQAGVGFILIAAIAGSLRYDLARTNALKIVCTAAFTSVALLIFIARDQISWLPGLLLASGSILGAQIAVKITINISQNALKWFLFVMTIFASLAAIMS